MRRISVRRSASGDGAIPAACSFARMNASTGVRTHVASREVGGSTFLIGLSDHQSDLSAAPARAAMSMMPKAKYATARFIGRRIVLIGLHLRWTAATANLSRMIRDELWTKV